MFVITGSLHIMCTCKCTCKCIHTTCTLNMCNTVLILYECLEVHVHVTRFDRKPLLSCNATHTLCVPPPKTN